MNFDKIEIEHVWQFVHLEIQFHVKHVDVLRLPDKLVRLLDVVHVWHVEGLLGFDDFVVDFLYILYNFQKVKELTIF